MRHYDHRPYDHYPYDHYRELIGPCDEFNISHDLVKQITTIYVQRGTLTQRQVLTFFEQSECHSDLIEITLKRMAYDFAKHQHPFITPMDLDLTWDEYHTQFGHLTDCPLDLVGKTLNHPALGIRVRVVEANTTIDKVTAKVEVLS